jgi:hypothetical protein
MAEARARSDDAGLLSAPLGFCTGVLYAEGVELLVMWGTFARRQPLLAALALVPDPLTGDCGLVRSRITPFARQNVLYRLLPADTASNDGAMQGAALDLYFENGSTGAPLIERIPSFVLHMSSTLDEAVVRECFRVALRGRGTGSLACLCEELERFPDDPWLRPTCDGDALWPAGTAIGQGPWSDEAFTRWWSAVTGGVTDDLCATLDAWEGAIKQARDRLPTVVDAKAAKAFVRCFLAPAYARMLAWQSAQAGVGVN